MRQAWRVPSEKRPGPLKREATVAPQPKALVSEPSPYVAMGRQEGPRRTHSHRTRSGESRVVGADAKLATIKPREWCSTTPLGRRFLYAE